MHILHNTATGRGPVEPLLSMVELGNMGDERKPLCINLQEASEDSRQRRSISSLRLITPPSRSRSVPKVLVTAEDGDVPSSLSAAGPRPLRRSHTNTYTQSAYSHIADASTSGEFVSIQGSDVTTEALELCEKWALRHYRRILMILGWMPAQCDCCGPRLNRVLHVMLVMFWTLVILGAFVAQILSCFRRDKFFAFNSDDTWRTYNRSCRDLSELGNATVGADDEGGSCRTLQCDHRHIVTNFILFDVLLLVVYLYGVFLFRAEDGENLSYLHNLASRAFVLNSLCSEVAGKKGSNRRLLMIILFFCAVGCLWVFGSLIVRILTVLSASLFDENVAIHWPNMIFWKGEKVSLIVFSLVGCIFFDAVYMSTTINYAVQSELIIWLVSSVTELLYNNDYPTIDAAIKDILECRRYLRTLNGRASTGVALVLFIVGNIATVSLLTLNKVTDYDDNSFKVTVALLNSVSWFFIVSLPIIQAVRVTRSCQLLKDAAAEIRSRPQLYANTSQLDLDSFLLLTQAIRLRATLFGVPMYPSLVYGVLTTAAFLLILLSQNGVYTYSFF